MRLSELGAKFVRREVRVERGARVRPERWEAVQARGGAVLPEDLHIVEAEVEHRVEVDTLAEADGVQYLCPKCFTCNGGPVGTHSILNWFVGKVPDNITPTGGRWIPQGELENLTYIGPSSASVLLTGACQAHFHIRDGAIHPCDSWKPGDPDARGARGVRRKR